MKMFDSAYLRLTACYVAVVMAISLLFSVWVYNQARNELRSGLGRAVELKPLAQGGIVAPTAFINDRLSDSSQRVLTNLVLLNISVLIVGAGASYWLARRTMRPVEEAVQAQERFTADASHELRTPLAAMKAEIEVGLRDKQLSKDEAVALLKSNLEEIDRLGGLAEGLLTLTQSDSPAALQPLALDSVAKKVSARMQPLADTKKIEIKRELHPVTAEADEATLDKILGILLDNAIKYSPASTVITLRTYQKDGHGYLQVEDQGIGIRSSDLPHIFDRFYRADTSRTKTHVAGHGLGLSIAQKLAEALNAKINATSTPAKGSIFTLELLALD